MNKKLLHAVTLGTMLTLTAASYALAMDHSAMGHGTPVVAPPDATAPPASASLEIRKVVVTGYTLTYTLIDVKQMMAGAKMTQSHDMSKMKSHHLMVNPVGPDGKAVATGKAGYIFVQPDKTEIKAMAMLMQGGFGADIDLVAKGDYTITTKIAFGDTTLVDEFVYTVK